VGWDVGKLNALKVKGLKAPGRYGDGGGLWLQVRDADHRSWCFRFTFGGKAREMGLGPVDDVPLADARDLAREARGLVRVGVDPIARRRDAKASARSTGMTFGEVGDLYIASHRDSWRNAKHAAQWRTTLDTYALSLKPMAVARVDTEAVIKVIGPIWRSKPETASRVRGRIEAVLDYATSRGWRAGDNPAHWRGHIQNLLSLPPKNIRVKHHAALPWPAIGSFMVQLAGQSGTAARALAFTILTACRTSEVVEARWSEINLAAAIWIVPGSRMKAGREHRVPLSDPALDVLRAMDAERTASADGPVFPRCAPRQAPLDGRHVGFVASNGTGGHHTGGHHGSRLPLHLSRLVRRKHKPFPRVGGGRPGARRPEQSGGRLSAWRPIRQADAADGGLGCVLPPAAKCRWGRSAYAATGVTRARRHRATRAARTGSQPRSAPNPEHGMRPWTRLERRLPRPRRQTSTHRM